MNHMTPSRMNQLPQRTQRVVQPLVDCVRRGQAFAKKAVIGATSEMSPKDHELLYRLQTLLTSLMDGDPAARDAATKLKAAAKRGDRVAFAAWNTLAALYWRKNSPTWQKAEALYARLVADDLQASAIFKSILAQAKLQDPRGDDPKKAVAMLKAIHNHRKESVWYPGAPRTGYYPMPARHRPGIVIGGYVGAHPLFGHGQGAPLGVNRHHTGGPFDNLPGLPAGFPSQQVLNQVPGLLSQIPGASPGQLGTLPGFLGSVPGAPGAPGAGPAPPGSSVPGLPAIPGIAPGQLPGLLAQVPGLGQLIPGLGNATPGQIPGLLSQAGIDPSNLGALLSQVPGLGQVLTSPQGQALGNFLPLTPEAAASLISMIAQARQALGNGGGGFPLLGGGGLQTSSFASPGAAPLHATFALPKPSQAVANLRATPGKSAAWVKGFDLGTVTSQGRSQPGPTQDAARANLGFLPGTGPNGMGTAAGNAIVTQALAGFDAARAQQYAMTLGKLDPGLRVLFTDLGNQVMGSDTMTQAISATLPNADAKRGFAMGVGYLWGDPAAAQYWPWKLVGPQLGMTNPSWTTGWNRAMAILKGTSYDGTQPIDAMTRTKLAEVGNATLMSGTGQRITAARGALVAIRNSLPPGPAQRGFDIAVALAYGPTTPFDNVAVGYTLNPADGTKQGFDRAITFAQTGR